MGNLDFATGVKDGAIVWDLESGQLLREFKGKKYGSALNVISPDGKRLLYGSSVDGTLRLWKIN